MTSISMGSGVQVLIKCAPLMRTILVPMEDRFRSGLVLWGLRLPVMLSFLGLLRGAFDSVSFAIFEVLV